MGNMVEGSVELVFDGYRVSVREDAKGLETDPTDGSTMQYTGCHRTVHLTMAKMVSHN